MTDPGKKACYLIQKGGYFYREKWCGYTQFKFDAGRYTKEQAEAEASVEPWHMSAVHEDDVPDEREPDKFIAELRATIATLEARATAAEAKAAEMEEAKTAILQVIKHHSGSDHGVMGVRLLVDRATEAEGVKEGLEMAAKVAESWSTSQHIAHDIKSGVFPERSHVHDVIADAIRALIEKPR